MKLNQPKVVVLLKAANLVLTTIYTFGLIYVLVRVLGGSAYAFAVLATAFANYVLSSDLGYSVFVFSRLRRSVDLSDELNRGAFFSDSLTLYSAVSVGATIVACGVIWIVFDVDIRIRIGLCLLFFNSVASLPWILFRRGGAAVGLNKEIEIIEFTRRLGFVVLTGSMMMGMPFDLFGIAGAAVWVGSFVLAGYLFGQNGLPIELRSPSKVLTHFWSHRADIGASIRFTLLEFAIYNFPYLFIPVLFGVKTREVIIFDVFFKIVRFGTVAYFVAIEAHLPQIMHYYYKGLNNMVAAETKKVAALCSVPFLMAAIILMRFGNKIFAILLNTKAPIDLPVRLAMVVMLLGLMGRLVAGAVLSGSGEFKMLSRPAVVTLGLMAAWCVIVSIQRLTFDAFIIGYALIFIGYAAAVITLNMMFARTYPTSGWVKMSLPERLKPPP